MEKREIDVDAKVSRSEVLLTVEEIAARLRVKVSWVYRHADDLNAFRLGKYLRFSWPIVLDRLEALGQQTHGQVHEDNPKTLR
jgi:hypothetical protein